MFMVEKEISLVVIGSGPAGLAAAISAKKAGIEDVLIMERAENLGGLLHQCIHNGFGMHYFKEDLTGPEYGKRFIDEAKDLKIDTSLETMVLKIDQNRNITAVNRTKGLLKLRAGALILTMGCRERSRGAIGIPGRRPAGILTAGAAQRLINIEGYIPGKKIVILGSGDIGMIMARRLTFEGAKVEAVIEILPYASGLIRNEVQCLNDYNIPLLLSHTVINIHGEDRINAVTISKVDNEFKPIKDTERMIECDTLLLSVGLTPENELSKTAGVVLDPITGGPIVNDMMETSICGIFAAGNVVHVHDLVDYVSHEGELAGLGAAHFIKYKKLAENALFTVKAGENVRYIVPHMISGKRDVTLYLRVQTPIKNAILKGGNDLINESFPYVRPSEMIKIELAKESIEEYGKISNELIVNCVGD